MTRLIEDHWATFWWVTTLWGPVVFSLLTVYWALQGQWELAAVSLITLFCTAVFAYNTVLSYHRGYYKSLVDLVELYHVSESQEEFMRLLENRPEPRPWRS